MYKVFIENKPINFQINSLLENGPNSDTVWEKITHFLSSEEKELTIELSNEGVFDTIFNDYRKHTAAGGMVQRKDQFLFIKRNGLWDIAKGKMEKGESPEETAVREIEEECGLISPTIKSHLLDTWHTFESKGRKILKKTHWYWLLEGEKVDLIPQKEEGITDVAYFSPSDFHQIESNTYLSIIEVMAVLKKKLK